MTTTSDSPRPTDQPDDAPVVPKEVDGEFDIANKTHATGESNVDARVLELEDRLLRTLADLDNLRKRFQRELIRERALERATTAMAWLPVVDNLQRALDAQPEDTPLAQGVRATRDEALAVLARLGFRRFAHPGDRFDPRSHEAVGAIASDRPAGEIVSVVAAGYGNDEEVLRPARVIVSSGSAIDAGQ
jgi:molecular chaperone GrpE